MQTGTIPCTHDPIQYMRDSPDPNKSMRWGKCNGESYKCYKMTFND